MSDLCDLIGRAGGLDQTAERTALGREDALVEKLMHYILQLH